MRWKRPSAAPEAEDKAPSRVRKTDRPKKAITDMGHLEMLVSRRVPLNKTQCATYLGISRQRLAQIEEKALLRLRVGLMKTGLFHPDGRLKNP